MGTHWFGCMIQRSGSPGNYEYTVSADWANRPVNFISWGDAARFANWLTNGQPTGPQGLATTEDGSYCLNGAVTDEALMAVTRKLSARYVIPSADEWYKAAFHKNDGTTGNYWNYPTATDGVPSNALLTPDGGNNANFYQDGYTGSAPYYTTIVGEFELSDSPYGTFDQAGNVTEWIEAIYFGRRGLLGGGFYLFDAGFLHAAATGVTYSDPTADPPLYGFRIAEVPVSVAVVPEPATLALLALGGLGVIGRAARRRKD